MGFLHHQRNDRVKQRNKDLGNGLFVCLFYTVSCDFLLSTKMSFSMTWTLFQPFTGASALSSGSRFHFLPQQIRQGKKKAYVQPERLQVRLKEELPDIGAVEKNEKVNLILKDKDKGLWRQK